MIPFKPREVDEQALDKMLIKSYRDERLRRVRTVDDEFRDDIPTALPTGVFRLADMTVHEPIEERAFNELGGKRVMMNTSYTCPHCHEIYACAIPPEECRVCHTKSWFGELVGKGSFRR